MALPGTERVEPTSLKEDLPDHAFHTEKSAFIWAFLLQITLSWKQSLNTVINYEHCSHHTMSLYKWDSKRFTHLLLKYYSSRITSTSLQSNFRNCPTDTHFVIIFKTADFKEGAQIAMIWHYLLLRKRMQRPLWQQNYFLRSKLLVKGMNLHSHMP